MDKDVMENYRVAILGCRARGTASARAYSAHPRTQIVGLCDRVNERTAALGGELSVAPLFEDVDAMIVQTVPDIVVIATGTEFHYQLALQVLEHGVHIDVEKPLCVDLLQADALAAKAEQKGARVAVHHQGSVGAAVRAAAQALAQGRVGQLRHIAASGKGYYGGYGLMNIGTHLLNLIARLAGHCRTVSALASTGGHPIGPEAVLQAPSGMGTIAGEHITANLDFDDGLSATLLQHRFPQIDSNAYGIEFLGTEGRLMWRSRGVWQLPQPHFLPDGRDDAWQALELVYPDHFDPECGAAVDDYWFVEEYVQALDEGRDHTCSGAEARHVVEIMMGIFESAAYRRHVPLPQVARDHPLLRWRREHGLPAPEPGPRPYEEWLAAEDRRLGRSSA